jgi:hypothetical protein
MGTFATALHVGFIDGNQWCLLHPLIYLSRKGLLVTCPAGMTTDFASIPRLLWWRYPKSGPWAPAAVIHDGLYAGEAVTLPRVALTRRQADAMLRDGMKALGIGWQTRLVFYLAVRLGGRRAWTNARSEAVT